MVPRRYLRSILAARSGGVRRGPATRRRRRPALEPLESRRLPSNIVEIPTTTPASEPREIAAGPDGRLWFAESGVGKIASIDPATHQIAEYSLSSAASFPGAVTAGPGGKIWFTEAGTSEIGSIDPIGRRFPGGQVVHALAEYAVPTLNSSPAGIAAGPDGKLWFTESAASKIGSFDPATHGFAEYAVAAGSTPEGIVAGPDGKLWFTEKQGPRIGSIDPKTGHIAEYTISIPTQPDGIAVGPDGRLWFADELFSHVGSFDPETGQIAVYPIPGTATYEVAAGPDGEMWFTEATTYRNPDGTINLMYSEIGTIDPTTHKVTESEIPTGTADPLGIAVGPEGNIWFTENENSAVGVLAPTLDLVATGLPTAQVALGAAFGLTISVDYQDGAVDTGFDGEITLALADPGLLGATLGGPLTARAHAGVATFTGLTLDRPGTYGIAASLGPQGPAMTVAVTVAVPPSSGRPPTTATPPTTGAPPAIVAAAPVLAGRGRHKRLTGFELDFSAAMDPARAADSAEYSLVQLRRRGRRLVSRPVGLRASYDATAHRVTLILVGRPKFAAGGKLMVAGGLVDAAGVPLDGGGATLVIARKGKGLSR